MLTSSYLSDQHWIRNGGHPPVRAANQLDDDHDEEHQGAGSGGAPRSVTVESAASTTEPRGRSPQPPTLASSPVRYLARAHEVGEGPTREGAGDGYRRVRSSEREARWPFPGRGGRGGAGGANATASCTASLAKPFSRCSRRGSPGGAYLRRSGSDARARNGDSVLAEPGDQEDDEGHGCQTFVYPNVLWWVNKEHWQSTLPSWKHPRPGEPTRVARSINRRAGSWALLLQPAPPPGWQRNSGSPLRSARVTPYGSSSAAILKRGYAVLARAYDCLLFSA